MRLALITLLCCGTLLAACGKKSPLQLPPEQPKQTETQNS